MISVCELCIGIGTCLPYNFFVVVAPVVSEQPESVTVMSANEVIELRCHGTGSPIPDILWYRNESSVETEIDASSESFTILDMAFSANRTRTSVLTISPSIENSGEYFCVVSSIVADFSDVMSDVAIVLVQCK